MVAKRPREGMWGWWAQSAREPVSWELHGDTHGTSGGQDDLPCAWPLASFTTSQQAREQRAVAARTEWYIRSRTRRRTKADLASCPGSVCRAELLQPLAARAPSSPRPGKQKRNWEPQSAGPVPQPWLPLLCPLLSPCPQGWLARDTHEGRSSRTRDVCTSSGLQQGHPGSPKARGAVPVALAADSTPPGRTPTEGPWPPLQP